MKEDMEIMKKNKFTKILMYSIFSCLIAISIFLMISYFGKEEEVQKNNSSDIRINQEQTEQVKDSKENQKIIGQLMLPKFQVINRVVIIVV